MKKQVVALVLLVLAVTGILEAQDGSLTFFPAQPAFYTPFSLDLYPGISLPLGSDSEYFGFGGALDVEGAYRMPFLPLLAATAGAGYNIFSADYGGSLSVVHGGAGAKAIFDLTPRLSAEAWLAGGYFYAFLNSGDGPPGGNPYISTGARISYAMGPATSVGIGTAFCGYLGLYNGLTVTLGSSIRVGALPRRGGMPGGTGVRTLTARGDALRIDDVQFQDVLPMFLKYYDDHPVGKASLTNTTSRIVEDLMVTVFVKQYMDNPKQCTAPTQLNPKEEQQIELNALFNEKMLDITETTKVSAEIVMEYMVAGTRYQQSHVETIRIFDRNAITWDDDRKAAVFVTAKDPTVLTFSKNILSMTQDSGSKAINRNLKTAIAFYQALSLYGLSYVVDPTTPYKELSKDETAIDFLQFPRQTFQYKAGDCDDLSVLYASLLESVGIETAFITIPGHIFMALSLDITAEEARRAFYQDDDLIYLGDRTWLPVEVTELRGGFIKAWEAGAQEWREAIVHNHQGFYPTHEAWQEYEPVGLSDAGATIPLPDSSRIVSSYLQELLRFVDREIFPQISELETQVRRYGESLPLLNKMGVVYARYGQDDKAEPYFRKALAKDPRYMPALVNLGNLYFLQENFYMAKNFYEQAYRLRPNHPAIILAVAKVNNELGNYSTVRDLYGDLQASDP
jgi:tetratricopeptide (TPR) repeat protein